MGEAITAAIIAKLSDIVLGHFSGKVLDAAQRKIVSAILKDRNTKAVFKKAIIKGLEQFNHQCPAFNHILFHQDDFFKPYILPQLARLLERANKPNISELEENHRQVFGQEFAGVQHAMQTLVNCIESSLNEAPELAPFLDSANIREIRESIRNEISPDLGNIGRDVGEIKKLVEQVSLDEVQIKNDLAPLDESTTKQLLHEKSLDLLSWPQTLSSGEWIERPELEALQKTVNENENSSIVLLGGPGSGKSALLARFGSMATSENHHLLAIKADMMPSEINSQEQLRKWLSLPIPVEDCIRELAEQKKVILLIDQLDALCDLIDIRTERLSVLIDLANRFVNVPNVYTILSCRDFEFKYDVRFQRLGAEELCLSLPNLDTVDELLKKRSIDVSSWPANFREMLRTPQHLKIYFDFLSDIGTPEFSTYQTMLEAVWQKQIVRQVSGAELALLAQDVATSLAENEELWSPVSRFEDHFKNVERLVANGILTFDAERKKIGFAHQTLFDFTRAKAFAAGKGKLADFVLARQGALFIRPALWSSLVYLRGTSTVEYYREFAKLWEEKTLRTHVRLMLMEFLGGLNDPDDQEALWLMPYLEHEKLSGTALAVMQGSLGWFYRIRDSFLPAIMCSGNETARRASWFLRSAWDFARKDILDLIEKHWLREPKKNELALELLNYLGSWDERSCAIAEKILSRMNIRNEWYINGLIATVSASRPELAPILVKAVFTSQLNIAKNETKKEKLPDSNDVSVCENEMEEQVAELMSKRFQETAPFSKLLEANDWYDLPEIAKAAPRKFLEEVFPWFVQVITITARDENKLILTYKDNAGLATCTFDMERKGKSYPVMLSLVVSVETVAENDPDGFIHFMDKWKDLELLSVHRLLAKGLEKLISKRPNVVLEYLLADPRRFVVGDMENYHSYSQILISQLSEVLDDVSFCLLEKTILEWKYYQHHPKEDGPALKRDRAKYEREHRLRLLLALSQSKLSDAAKKFVEEEKRAFPHIHNYECKFSGVREIGSPVSGIQMEKASDEHILQLFEELTDETDWDHPKRRSTGGSIQASRAFGVFAKNNPDRALALIENFEPKKQERPASEALQILAKEGLISKDRLVEIINCLSQKGFESNEFRYSAADALGYVASKPEGLSDDICIMLKSWLVNIEPQHCDSGDENDKEDKYESLLWGYKGSRLVPQGNLTVLETLMRGYLLRQPCDYNVWLEVLEEHLNKREDPRVWQFLADKFHLLSNADRKRSERLIKEVLNNHINGTLESVICVANNIHWLSPELVHIWLDNIRDGGWQRGYQAYGEMLVVGLHYGSDSQQEWYNRRVQELLHVEQPKTEKYQQEKLGIAHGAAHLWKENNEVLTPIICNLFDMADNHIASALMGVFRVDVSFPPNKYTRAIIDAIIASPQSLKGTADFHLIEKLIGFLPVEPERVYQICGAIIDQCGKDVANMQTGLSSSAGELIDITLTLQRLHSYRGKGLELFERLLELDVYGIKGVLFDLDRRPFKSQPSMPRRRRVK